jgi:hypothetical protein
MNLINLAKGVKLALGSIDVIKGGAHLGRLCRRQSGLRHGRWTWTINTSARPNLINAVAAHCGVAVLLTKFIGTVSISEEAKNILITTFRSWWRSNVVLQRTLTDCWVRRNNVAVPSRLSRWSWWTWSRWA